MKKQSKRMRQAKSNLEAKKIYKLNEAVETLKSAPHPKFDETVEVAMSLAVDTKDSGQNVRGTVILPNGTGKKVRVVAFCKDENQNAAREAGADEVGGDELVEKIAKGFMDFDVCISTPDMMKSIARLGKVLGPRGLMPSPKAGTVTPEVAKAVKEAKAGKIQYRTDKTGNIQCPVGKVSFEAKAVAENVRTLVDIVLRSRPPAVKGRFVKSLYISTTMGPGLKLEAENL